MSQIMHYARCSRFSFISSATDISSDITLSLRYIFDYAFAASPALPPASLPRRYLLNIVTPDMPVITPLAPIRFPLFDDAGELTFHYIVLLIRFQSHLILISFLVEFSAIEPLAAMMLIASH